MAIPVAASARSGCRSLGTELGSKVNWQGWLDCKAQPRACFSGLKGEMLVNPLLHRLELGKLYLSVFIPSYTTLLL